MLTKQFTTVWKSDESLIKIYVPDDEILIVPELPAVTKKSIYISGIIEQQSFHKIAKHMEEIWIIDDNIVSSERTYLRDHAVLVIHPQNYTVTHDEIICWYDVCELRIIRRLKCRRLIVFKNYEHLANANQLQIGSIICNWSGNQHCNKSAARTQIGLFCGKMRCFIACMKVANVALPPKPIIKYITMYVMPNYIVFCNDILRWIWDCA